VSDVINSLAVNGSALKKENSFSSRCDINYTKKNAGATLKIGMARPGP